jgi:hypothetical protein
LSDDDIIGDDNIGDDNGYDNGDDNYYGLIYKISSDGTTSSNIVLDSRKPFLGFPIVQDI